MTGGSHLLARGREEAGYRFRFDFLGRGLDLELGQIVSLGPFLFLFHFASFLFCFLYFFKSFLEIDLN
jgi:hypothetical protein